MNDFKLATPLGSPLPNNKDKTTFYGAMRLTYDRLATKYPNKMIWLVIPQKRYDENTDYGGGIYHQYLKAQVDVAKEYGIPTIDLYNNFPNSKPTFYNTYMLNDTHFNEYGNDYVAELIARSMIGGGNSAFGFSFDLMKTSPDGNVWKLDWSIDNNGNITWSPVKLTT
jgi:lysophospholipase L1-like esterase